MKQRNDGMCNLEKLCKILGFRLVHDGQRNPGQFKFPPDQVACFTRKYRLHLFDGQAVDWWVVFKYDRRKPLADFEFFGSEPKLGLVGREKFKMTDDHARKLLKKNG